MDSKINEKQEVGSGGINLFGTSLPTEEWNFAEYLPRPNPYVAEFSEVGAGIYTQRYFKGFASYTVGFSELKRASGGKMTYCLYDMTAGTFSKQYQSNLLNSEAEGYCSNTFSGLNTDHKYCVWIRASGGAADLYGIVQVTAS